MLPGHCHHAVAVARAEDLVVARLTAEQLALTCGLAPDHKHRLDLIVAELGSNLVRHADGGGMMLFRCLADRGGADRGGADQGGLECICLDHGPGMADPDRALRDGESSDRGLGLGLGTVRRLSDVFALHSMPGVGTAVLARVCGRLPPDVPGLDVGAVMVPMTGLMDCGDGWVRTEGG
ncbi:MAG: ATP-binding protein, partial [Rhodopila sp.]